MCSFGLQIKGSKDKVRVITLWVGLLRCNVEILNV